MELLDILRCADLWAIFQDHQREQTRRMRRKNVTWLTALSITQSMSRAAKTTAMVQVNTYMLREVKVHCNFLPERDFNYETVAVGGTYDGVNHQHVDKVGSYYDHQHCVSCSDVAQMVPKQVNLCIIVCHILSFCSTFLLWDKCCILHYEFANHNNLSLSVISNHPTAPSSRFLLLP